MNKRNEYVVYVLSSNGASFRIQVTKKEFEFQAEYAPSETEVKVEDSDGITVHTLYIY